MSAGIIVPIFPDHPIYPMAQSNLLDLINSTDRATANAMLAKRNKMLELAESDPLLYGYKLDPWVDSRKMLRKYDEAVLLGGNRSSKSTNATDICVDTMVNGPVWLEGEARKARAKNVNVAFLHSSSQSSIIQQQALVHGFLPPELRDLGKIKGDKNTNIFYARKNGFSDNVFILPNGSMGIFFNYMQDVKVLEGYEFDLAWCDELVPKAFIEALRFRLATRSGKLLVTFTPVTGFTPVVKEFTAGSVIKESRPADPVLFPALVNDQGNLPTLVKGCPKGHMPYIAEGRNKTSAIMYFHSNMNMFSPYQEIVNKCAGRSSPEVKMRAYGYTSKLDGGAFPRFSSTHILTHKQWLEIKAREQGAHFCVCDPGGTKNWFIKWYYCTRDGDVILYREWPDLTSYGEWALPSDKVDYKAGPAQRLEAGRGIEAYKRLVLEMEGWKQDPDNGEWDDSEAEVIEERIMDSRFGADERHGEGTSIFAMMEEENKWANGLVNTPPMYWNPARGGGSRSGLKPTEVGIQIINEMMDYNEEKEVNAMNRPRWYVTENCQQSIYAYQEFTGIGTEKDALKDVVDPDRYLVCSDVYFLDSSTLECLGGGSY